MGMMKWLPPYQIELETWGRRYGEIVMTSGSDLILSERIVEVFQRNKLRGLEEIEPVEIVKVVHHRRKPPEPLPHYFKATVVRSQTTVDEKASGMQWAPCGTPPATIASRQWKFKKPDCPVCLYRKGIFVRQQRLVIQPDTWTGEDIFCARSGAVKFIVSARFKEICERKNVLGVVFVPAAECEVDFYPSESKFLLKVYRAYMDKSKSREGRVNAYRTLAFVAKSPLVSNAISIQMLMLTQT